MLESVKDENYFMNFKKLASLCLSNRYAFNCLNKLIYLNLKNFEPIFIFFLYDNFLIIDNKLYDVNDLQYYKLCKEIIKEINIINNIFYFMNNKDIAIINCDNESKIKGINILYIFLIETKNDIIRNDLTDFLTDIFYGIKLNKMEQNENYWNNFIKSIYNKLDEIIKLEKEENNEEQSQSIQGIISLIKKIENKFISKGEIIENLKYIKEEIRVNKNEINKKKKGENNDNNNVEKYKKIIYSGNVYGKDNILNYDVKFDDTEYFYMFRYKLSLFFKIPLNLIN